MVLRPHPWPSPDKAAGLSAPESRGGPGTGEETRADSASRRGAWVLSPPLACPQGAGLGLRMPPVWGRHPTRRSSRADTRPRWRCKQEAPRHRFIHTHVPLVCAPPACRRYPAGATGISGRPHPPRPQRCAPGVQSLLGVSAAASKDQAPPLRARLLSKPAGRCAEAAPPAPVPRSPFPVDGGVQSLPPAAQPPPTASQRVQQEGVPEAPAPFLNPSLAFSITFISRPPSLTVTEA